MNYIDIMAWIFMILCLWALFIWIKRTADYIFGKDRK